MVRHDTVERIKKLETEFDGLHQQLVSELTEGNICSRDELLRAITIMPISVRNEYQSLIEQKIRVLLGSETIFELLLHLGPLFTFIDYGFLYHLISKFGSLKLRNDMQAYVSKIQVFMQETSVDDLIKGKDWPGGEESHVQNYSKLKAKFSDDPKTLNVHTREIEPIQTQILQQSTAFGYHLWSYNDRSGRIILYHMACASRNVT
jgi:hypothetical protein